MTNAGHRLWNVQKSQGTGLCVGLDPHTYPVADQPEFYSQFVNWPGGSEAQQLFAKSLQVINQCPLTRRSGANRASTFLGGLVAYYLAVIEAAWAAGIRLFKPQAAFYEVFEPFGDLVLEILLKRLEDLTSRTHEMVIIVLYRIKDAKRGDIDSTQEPYYRAILSDANSAEIYPGMSGRQGFNTMTVTTWMGIDVLTPGLALFRQGHGAIVVTRSSNPSGCTLQDVLVEPNMEVKLSAKQEPFRYTAEHEAEIMDIIGRQPMAHEVMLWQTEKFSRDNELNQDGVSPLFSVMGSTVEMLPSFRQLRSGGIALVPGFGEQGGAFANIMPLRIQEGPLAGHLGILSSSRAHNFPWMKKYGGGGDPAQLGGEMRRMIDQFRADEKAAYAAAGLNYPF